MKAIGIMKFIWVRPEFWICFAITFLFQPDAPWTEPFQGVAGKISPLLRRWLLIPAGIVIGYLFLGVSDSVNTLAALAGIGMCGAIVLGMWAWVERSVSWIILVVNSVLCTFAIAVSSTNHYYALFWALPALIIPFIALQAREASVRIRPVGHDGILEEGYGYALLVLFVGVIAFGAYTHQRTRTYYDVPPGNCDTKLTIPPLEGLKTSARRAYLTRKLYDLVKDRDFVLAFADNPGPFLFSHVRSAVDTTIVEAEAPLQTNQRSIARMWDRRRIPSLIIKTKVHPWYWGINHPLSREAYFYPTNDPYSKFAQCARSRTVENFEEFEAYEVDASKVESCVKAINPPVLASIR